MESGRDAPSLSGEGTASFGGIGVAAVAMGVLWSGFGRCSVTVRVWLGLGSALELRAVH